MDSSAGSFPLLKMLAVSKRDGVGRSRLLAEQHPDDSPDEAREVGKISPLGPQRFRQSDLTTSIDKRTLP